MRSLAAVAAVAVVAAGFAVGKPDSRARATPGETASTGAEEGLLAGCPPELGVAYGGCEANRSGFGAGRDSAAPPPLPSGNGSVDVDGYRLRLGSDGRVIGYSPLPGGALLFGRAWPDGFGSTALPPYVIAHYGLGSAKHWREAERVVYRIDPETHAIIATAALLTGQRFVVGKPAPPGYEIYNLPLAYRARWADSEAASYRYADGRVYRIVPATGIVAAAIDLPAIPGSET